MRYYLNQTLELHPELSGCIESMASAIDLFCSAFKKGNKIMTCGNGGSSSDADHIVAELMKGFQLKRRPDESLVQKLKNSEFYDNELADGLQLAFPAVSLNGNMALVTAISNDICYENIFAQQVFGLGNEGDLLVCLSTSGNSTSIINAARVARIMGIKVIGFTGRNGGRLADYCDIALNAPSDKTHLVQEYHISMYHAICAEVEQILFGD